MGDEQPKKQPTASEAMFFFAIVKHTKNKADIDWNAVAGEQGFKSAEVAKVRGLKCLHHILRIKLLQCSSQQVRFGQVKRKLGIDGATPSPATKKTGAPSAVAGTPTKARVAKNTGRTGARGRKSFKAKKEAGSSDEVPDEEERDAKASDDETHVKREPGMADGTKLGEFSMDQLLNF
jgi:hypothetical protein